MSLLLGVIADDFTGATDIAGFLVANGLATTQLIGVPEDEIDVEAEAIVISLKSRSCLAEEAISESLKALEWLRRKGCKRIFQKYCSTFDSSKDGNIGPVADALLDALGDNLTVVCPALPINGRTIYNGYLFVNGVLLEETGIAQSSYHADDRQQPDPFDGSPVVWPMWRCARRDHRQRFSSGEGYVGSCPNRRQALYGAGQHH